MEKVDSRTHPSGWPRIPLVNLGLHLPGLAIALLWIDVVEVLGPIRLLLAAGRSLPRLKLLEDLAFGVMDGHYWLPETFPD